MDGEAMDGRAAVVVVVVVVVAVEEAVEAIMAEEEGEWMGPSCRGGRSDGGGESVDMVLGRRGVWRGNTQR